MFLLVMYLFGNMMVTDYRFRYWEFIVIKTNDMMVIAVTKDAVFQDSSLFEF